MADKTLGMLVPATDIFPTDLFLVEQSGVAKNVPGQVMINFLVRVADGHGGVSDFQKLSESGLEKTYQFLMADGTKYQFTVTDGNGIANFKESVSGLVHTCKFIMDDGTEYSFKVSDGEKGDKGDNAYVHIRFASQKPTSSSSSMGTEPDAWIGFYSGNKAVAPTDPMEYTWAPFKGEKGNTGAPATIVTNKTEYQVSDSGTIVPSGSWSTAIPPVTPGKYLWARTTTQFNTGAANYAYSISRFGIDGSGSVVTVNNVSPDESGNVVLTAEQLQCLGLAGGTMTGPINMNGQAITGLNDPVGETDAARKSYVDKSTKLAAPYNWLDNGDFRNPVNQRGQTQYTAGHCLDRWRIEPDGITVSLGKGYVSMTKTVSETRNITQNLGNIDSLIGKTITFVLKCSGNATIVLGYYAGGSTQYAVATKEGDFIIGTFTVPENTQNLTFFIQPQDMNEVKLYWAAVYEGTYTVDTLPDFQAKGYGAELAECRRYYQEYREFYVNLIQGQLGEVPFWYGQPMRIVPTVTVIAEYFTGSSWISDTISPTPTTTACRLYVSNPKTSVYRIDVLISADL